MPAVESGSSVIAHQKWTAKLLAIYDVGIA